MIVLISLVGKQAMPVYLGIKSTRADLNVFVHSKDTVKEVTRIASFFPDANFRYKVLDPTDLIAIKSSISSLFQEYKDDEILINISSGTKPWTYAFIKAFEKNSSSTFFYIDQNCVKWNLSTNDKETLQFDGEIQLKLNGNFPKKFKDLTDYTGKDFRVIKQLETMRHKYPKDFNELTTIFPKKNSKQWTHKVNFINSDRLELDNGSFIEWEKPDWIRMAIRTKKGYDEIDLTSEHAVSLSFSTSWFEVKVAQILSGWDKAKSIILNCVFSSASNQTKNEVDIIVFTQNRVLFVECKTQIFNNTDIDKFRTVVKNYGGMGSKAIFITEAEMNDISRLKCEESQIIPFSLGVSVNIESAKEELFKLLDSQINDINTI